MGISPTTALFQAMDVHSQTQIHVFSSLEFQEGVVATLYNTFYCTGTR